MKVRIGDLMKNYEWRELGLKVLPSYLMTVPVPSTSCNRNAEILIIFIFVLVRTRVQPLRKHLPIPKNIVHGMFEKIPQAMHEINQ